MGVLIPPSARVRCTVSGSLDTVDRNVCGRGYVVIPALPLQPLELGQGTLQAAVVQRLVFEGAVESCGVGMA